MVNIKAIIFRKLLRASRVAASTVFKARLIIIGGVGAIGPQGFRGDKGDKGAKGDTGPASVVKGPKGDVGDRGPSVLCGTGSPAGSLGFDGDSYVDLTAFRFYGPKVSGSWGSGVSLVGPRGPAGPDAPP